MMGVLKVGGGLFFLKVCMSHIYTFLVIVTFVDSFGIRNVTESERAMYE